MHKMCPMHWVLLFYDIQLWFGSISSRWNGLRALTDPDVDAGCEHAS